MKGNIKARETLQLLIDYPEREFPEADDPNDKNNKNKKAVPKKKKKKEPPFATPPWADELDAVVLKVKEMGELANDRVNLKLDDTFITQVQERL